MGQLVGEMMRRLADDYVIPYNVEDVGSSIEQYVTTVLNNYENLMREKDLGFRIGTFDGDDDFQK